jgi:hypothetical protein
MASVTKTFGTITSTGPGSVAWSNPSNAQTNDANRATAAGITSGNVSEYLWCTDISAGIPDGATIDGVTVRVTKQASNSRGLDLSAQLIIDGAADGNDKALSPAWSNGSDAVSTYGGAADLWGLSLTPAMVNGSAFGFAISGRGNHAIQTTELRIAYVSIQIYYTEAAPTNYTLDPDEGDIALSESDADLLAGRLILCESGSYTVTGANVGLTVGASGMMSADDAGMAFDSSGHVWGDAPGAYLIEAAAGAYAISGASAALVRTSIQPARTPDSSGMAFDNAGMIWDMGETFAAYVLDPDAGAYAITGASTALSKSWIIGAEAGSVAVTGSDAGLLKGYAVEALSGAYAITGISALLLAGYAIEAEAGAVDLSGEDAGLTRTGLIDALPGAYALTGSEIDFSLYPAPGLDAESGAFQIAGSASDLLATRLLSPEAGEIEITGIDVGLSLNAEISAESGQIVLSGEAADLIATRLLSAEAGAVTITGVAASLNFGRTVHAEAGAITLSGSAAALIKTRVLSAGTGIFTLAGYPATLYHQYETYPSGTVKLTITARAPSMEFSVKVPTVTITLI